MFTHDVKTKIIISCPPAFVKQILLEFDKLPTWGKDFITNVVIAKPADESKGPKPSNLPGVGAKFSVTTAFMTYGAVVVRHTEDEFAWQGGIPMLSDGRHSFVFRAKDPAGKTTEFVHTEHLAGLATPLLACTGMHQGMKNDFETFNKELKARCEDLYMA